METICIRPAGSCDVDQILDISQSSGLSPWTRSDVEQETDRSDSIVLVSSPIGSDSNIVGFISGRLVPGTGRESGSEAEIYNVGVRPAFRGSGVGSRLLDEFVGCCVTAGAAKIWLEVRASNKTAIGFYRRHNFTETGIRKGFYRDPVEDAVLMSRSLGHTL